jgi:RNA polymerase sigma-70 factor (ECF subfamily)
VFAELYDRHAAGLHRHVTRRLGAGPAGDVAGETFLIAFRERGAASPPAPRPASGCPASPPG